jgi:hypothetical protein
MKKSVLPGSGHSHSGKGYTIPLLLIEKETLQYLESLILISPLLLTEQEPIAHGAF